jgi:hypothetical protein
MGPDNPAPQDAQAFIAALDEVDLSRFRVIGTYTRYDGAVPQRPSRTPSKRSPYPPREEVAWQEAFSGEAKRPRRQEEC